MKKGSRYPEKVIATTQPQNRDINIIALYLCFGKLKKRRYFDMQQLQIVEFKGKRVLTTQQLAQCYGTTRHIISNNFTRNKDRYVINKHYIPLEGTALQEFKTCHQFDDSMKRVSILYLWTEKGALLHAKSLNTDKAWEVYDYLVDLAKLVRNFLTSLFYT